MVYDFKTNDPKGAARYFEAKAAYSTGPAELEHALSSGRRPGVDFNLIDLRSADDFAKGHLPGATNLPEERWSSFDGLARERLNILYCYSSVCHLAARAGFEFAAAGFPVMEMDGGFESWKEHEFKTEGAEDPARPGLKAKRGPDPDAERFESLL